MAVAANIAQAITDLVDGLIAAINARAGKVGASAYDLYVLQGGALSQADWLTSFSGKMTAAQRAALAGSDLWANREVTETDTGLTYRYFTAASDFRTSAGWVLWRQPPTLAAPTQNSITGTAYTLQVWKSVREGLRVLQVRLAITGSGVNINGFILSIGDVIDANFPIVGDGYAFMSTNRFLGIYVRLNNAAIGQVQAMYNSTGDSNYFINAVPFTPVAGDLLQWEARYRVQNLTP